MVCKKTAWLHWVLLGQGSSGEHSGMHGLASQVFIAVLCTFPFLARLLRFRIVG